jgi:hypothetical protein
MRPKNFADNANILPPKRGCGAMGPRCATPSAYAQRYRSRVIAGLRPRLWASGAWDNANTARRIPPGASSLLPGCAHVCAVRAIQVKRLCVTKTQMGRNGPQVCQVRSWKCHRKCVWINAPRFPGSDSAGTSSSETHSPAAHPSGVWRVVPARSQTCGYTQRKRRKKNSSVDQVTRKKDKEFQLIVAFR